jgi:hypothetical protein
MALLCGDHAIPFLSAARRLPELKHDLGVTTILSRGGDDAAAAGGDAAAATNTPEDRANETNPPSAFKRRRCDRGARDSDRGSGTLAARFNADGGGALRSDWGPALSGGATDAAKARAFIISAFCSEQGRIRDDIDTRLSQTLLRQD